MIRSLFSPRRFRSLYVPWCLGGLVVFAVEASLAELGGPTASDRSITLAVVNLLRSEQLTRHPLDDEISHRTVKGLIKMLDPMKVYPGFPHGMPTTNADQINADLLAFVQRRSHASA